MVGWRDIFLAMEEQALIMTSMVSSAVSAVPVPRRVVIGENIVCGDGEPLLVIAGPCVIESEAMTLRIAERL
ncbi:MAG: hypothetical protein RMJ19_14390, partial [Gemmatales bacterium]|nr:hypothetical protein [Gemmatales bacterium]MDW8176860.1 hypothetical protein [Gemmatales bacterium]